MLSPFLFGVPVVAAQPPLLLSAERGGCRYGVPSSAASDFEATFKACQPDLCAHQPDVLFHLVTMLSPRRLMKHSIPVHSVTQAAGEFVITFPNAYHGGFNCGVNAAEAVNFVPADWLRFGAASQLRYRAFRKPGVLCHEELLLDATSRNESALTSYWVRPELSRVVDEEIQLRYNLWAAVRPSPPLPSSPLAISSTVGDMHFTAHSRRRCFGQGAVQERALSWDRFVCDLFGGHPPFRLGPSNPRATAPGRACCRACASSRGPRWPSASCQS